MGLAAAVVLAGCSTDSAPDAKGPIGGEGGSRPTAQLTSVLTPFESCGALLDEVRADALDHVGPYGIHVADDFLDVTVGAVDQTSAPAAESTGAAAPAASAGSSETNVQVAGVDEPDTVKLDGTTLYSTVSGSLEVLDLSGDDPVAIGALEMAKASRAPEMLLDGDRLLLVSGGYGGFHPLPGVDHGAVTPGVTGPTTELTLVDVEDPATPKVVEHVSLDGALLGARMVDGTARVVTATQGPNLEFEYPTGVGFASDLLAQKANERIIEDSELRDWLPQARTLDAAGTLVSDEPLVGCEDVSRPASYSGQGTLSVVTLDLAGGTLDTGGALAIQASGDTIYASAETLYVATAEVVDLDLEERGESDADRQDAAATSVPQPRTAIHAFDISGDDPATHLGTGEVVGHLLNQFSMDEHEGVLRVATTVDSGNGWVGGVVAPTIDDPTVGPSAPASSEVATGPSSESFVTTLELRDGELAQVGIVGGMGLDERIHSVRFLGDVGYVVTFRQTDPLYTLDLSDSAAPAVTGELKIPGYSAYLHPTEPGKLIGIGQDATDTGRRTGTQVSVFDVSDPADPKRTAQWSLPDGASMAESDHHAFLWWPDDDLLVIPARGGEPGTHDLEWDRGWFDGVIGLDVTDTSITERGRIVHDPAYAEQGAPTNGNGSAPLPGEPIEDIPSPDPGYRYDALPIHRSLVVEGRLVTISHAGVMVSDLATFDTLGWHSTGS